MAALAQENIWYNKSQCEEAERLYYEKLSGAKKSAAVEDPAEAAKRTVDEDDVDLFASDDESAVSAAKPAMVKPAAKSAKGGKAKKGDTKKADTTKPAAVEEKAAAVPNKQVAERLCQQPPLPTGHYRNAANAERTFIMLKPDAVQRCLVGTVIERFESRGLKLLAAKLMRADESLLRQHYADLSAKKFFPDLVAYMASGPVLPMVWQGLNAVKQGRAMLGATNPKDSAPGTIRGDFCVDVGRNLIHGSDSVDASTKEISLWFTEAEIARWRSVQTEWIYEEEEEVGQQKTSAQSSSPAKPPQVEGLASTLTEDDMALAGKLSALEIENKQLVKVTEDLKNLILKLEGRVAVLEGGKGAAPVAAKKEEKEEEEDVDLFGSDDEEDDAEKQRITDERLKAYSEKKSKKPALIAKTSVLFDVKPWDDETDMDAMLKAVKSLEMDGLLWGASKLVPVGYGINKLQIMCVVEDEKVSLEELGEKMEAFEDYVQSVDIAAMNKI